MECRGNLDECLQKGFIWFVGLQPDTLPVLVSEEELLVPVTLGAFPEAPAGQIDRHVLLIILPKSLTVANRLTGRPAEFLGKGFKTTTCIGDLESPKSKWVDLLSAILDLWYVEEAVVQVLRSALRSFDRQSLPSARYSGATGISKISSGRHERRQLHRRDLRCGI